MRKAAHTTYGWEKGGCAWAVENFQSVAANQLFPFILSQYPPPSCRCVFCNHAEASLPPPLACANAMKIGGGQKKSLFFSGFLSMRITPAHTRKKTVVASAETVLAQAINPGDKNPTVTSSLFISRCLFVEREIHARVALFSRRLSRRLSPTLAFSHCKKGEVS